jgi:hypothetical protein
MVGERRDDGSEEECTFDFEIDGLLLCRRTYEVEE